MDRQPCTYLTSKRIPMNRFKLVEGRAPTLPLGVLRARVAPRLLTAAAEALRDHPIAFLA